MILTRGVQYILFASIFFSISHAAVKYLQDIHVFQIVFFRALFTLVIGFFILKKRKIKIFGENIPLLLLRGLAGSIALCMYFYTLQKMPLATAVTIQYLSPLFAILFTLLFLNERFKLKQLPFILLAFAGVVSVKSFDPNVSAGLTLIAVSAAFFSGLAYACIRKLAGKADPHLVVFYFPFVTIPLITPLMLKHWKTPEANEWAAIILIGIFTYFAQILMTKAYHADKASTIAPFKYIGLIFSVIIGYFWFGESVSLQTLTGMAVIIFGVYMSNRFAQKP